MAPGDAIAAARRDLLVFRAFPPTVFTVSLSNIKNLRTNPGGCGQPIFGLGAGQRTPRLWRSIPLPAAASASFGASSAVLRVQGVESAPPPASAGLSSPLRGTAVACNGPPTFAPPLLVLAVLSSTSGASMVHRSAWRVRGAFFLLPARLPGRPRPRHQRLALSRDRQRSSLFPGAVVLPSRYSRLLSSCTERGPSALDSRLETATGARSCFQCQCP